RILPIKVDDLALVTGKPARLLRQRLVELLLADRNIGVAPDLGKQQAKPHPPLGDAEKLGLALLLVFVAGSGFAVRGALERGLLRRDDRRRVEPLLDRT